MKIKLSQILESSQALLLLAQKEMPAKVAYRVSKWVKKLVAENAELQEQRNKLIEKYGEKITQPDGQEVTKVKPENIAAYTGEMKTLLAEEVELDGVVPVKFADIENLNLSPAVLADLEFMIEAPQEVT